MKVPKAGRPLAKCPHPKGSCSCQKLYAFMVRIPKGWWFCILGSTLSYMPINPVLGSTCLCRPVYKVPADSTDTSQPTPPPSAAPESSPAPGRVQKNGRRQSYLQAAPENLTKALESISGFEGHQEEAGASNHLPSYPPHNPAFNDSHPLPSNFDPSNPFMPQESVRNSGNATPQRSTSRSAKPQLPMQNQDQGSCCGEPNLALGNGVQMESRQRDSLLPQTNGIPYHKSSPAHQVPQWQDVDTSGQDHSSQPFSAHQSQTQTPARFYECGPNTSSTTASLGLQNQSSLDDICFAQPPMHSLLSNNSQSFTYTPPQAFGESSQKCSCGNDCQCLGCATHPFNNTTRQHVQEMGALVSLDGEETDLEGLNGYQNSALPGHPGGGLVDYSFAGIGNPNDVQQSGVKTYPGQAATPDLGNGYSSPTGYTSGQQLMTPSEYYTLEYSVGLPNACTDMTGSCQCGSDCSCVGCLTHSGHNGISLEPSAMDDITADAMESSGSDLERPGASLSRIPVLDDLSVPSSTPHAIEP